ncbi:hypothetical protein ACH4OW_11435 [Streptomyces sp. NPDC017056]|uniref:hypothetical protein n=1 Tax=Streptomyces sp. NPDC017056 TaxID=3364973 RepID=UPI0037A189B8
MCAGSAQAGPPEIPARTKGPAPRAVSVNTHRATLEFDTDGSFEGDAVCPDRRARATGGGFDLQDGGRAFESRPAGARGWHVTADAPGIVYVRCLLIT